MQLLLKLKKLIVNKLLFIILTKTKVLLKKKKLKMIKNSKKFPMLILSYQTLKKKNCNYKNLIFIEKI